MLSDCEEDSDLLGAEIPGVGILTKASLVHAGGESIAILGLRQISIVTCMAMALGLAGCSSSPSSVRPQAASVTATSAAPITTTTRPIGTGSAYNSAAESVDTAVAAFKVSEGSWSATTSDSQVEADAQPLVIALQGFARFLITEQWPGNAAADVRLLTSDIEALIGDISAVASVSQANAQSFETQLARDYAALSPASDQIRQDLGLPPLPTTTTNAPANTTTTTSVQDAISGWRQGLQRDQSTLADDQAKLLRDQATLATDLQNCVTPDPTPGDLNDPCNQGDVYQQIVKNDQGNVQFDQSNVANDERALASLGASS